MLFGKFEILLGLLSNGSCALSSTPLQRTAAVVILDLQHLLQIPVGKTQEKNIIAFMEASQTTRAIYSTSLLMMCIFIMFQIDDCTW